MMVVKLPEHVRGSKPEPGLRMTYDEFLDADFGEGRFEWVEGEPIEMPNVDQPHAELSGWISTTVRMLAQLRDLGRVYSETFQMRVRDDLPGRNPDCFFVRKGRLHLIERRCLRGPADLVVEIVSPESRTRDRRTKFREYQQGGVPEYWLVDPIRQVFEPFELIDGTYVPIDIDDAGGFVSPTLGVRFEIAWFWTQPQTMDVLKAWSVVQ